MTTPLESLSAETRTFAPPELAASANATADTYDAAPDAPTFWARHFGI